MNEVLGRELFHKEYLQKGKRLDGRLFNAKRTISATRNCIEESDGSSLVSLGKTIVVTKITASPQPIAPSIEINATRAGVSQIKGSTTQDKTLTAMLNVLANRMIPMSELEIARPDPNDIFMSSVKLWGYKLSIDICVISDDGGVEAASVIGFQIALSTLNLETYSLDEEGQIHPLNQSRPLNFLSANAMRFGLLDGKLLYDPTNDEEKLVDGCCTIIMSAEESPKLMKVSTTRTFLLNEDLIASMTSACSSD
ncbi:hypothetical protein TRFO_37292 [Tritrichomonas foetus]|uniref:Ribosomal RNA-processing protein 43 n=1 Tax=Tritrichomonas foetus TaxID=1144522 RepID=A0A1J4JBJ0_9EUKA|nr:hypothetical protein TRFO_37292 [Tritrichomonas foetus]|eukprot:OHS96550.1 hypothetical protein TRFO_37292 [Tritrichomonas foetus]